MIQHHCPRSLQATMNNTEGQGDIQIKGLVLQTSSTGDKTTPVWPVFYFSGGIPLRWTSVIYLQFSTFFHSLKVSAMALKKPPPSTVSTSCSAAGNGFLVCVKAVCVTLRITEEIFLWWRNSSWGNCKLQESWAGGNKKIGKEKELGPF